MSFILLLLYIIAVYIRPQEWVPAVYGWPLINILAIATAIFIVWDIVRSKRSHIREPQTMLLVVFLGCVVMSHLFHTRPYFGGAFDSFTKFGTNVVMFLLFVNVLTTTGKIKISMWLIVVLTALLAFQGIYQFQNGIGWAGQPLVRTEGAESIGRITWVGIFNDPNDLALIFVVAIGFLLAFLLGRSKILFKVVSIPLMGVLLYALYLTNSRGGYLAFVVTVTYFFLRKMKSKWVALVIGLVMAVAILGFSPSRMSDISAEEESAQERIEAWYEGFQMLKSAPLFGVGYRMFTDYHYRTAHNSYVLVAAEEGFVGLFVWVSLISLCFKGLYKLSKDGVNGARSAALGLGPYIFGLEVGLIGFLSAVFFLSRAYIEPFYILLALASTLAFTTLKKGEYTFTAKDARFAGVLSMGILMTAWVTMKLSLMALG